MDLSEVVCSKCQRSILRKSTDGKWRLSSKVIKTKDDGTGMVVVCRVCSNEQAVPLMLSMSPVEIQPRGSFHVRTMKT